MSAVKLVPFAVVGVISTVIATSIVASFIRPFDKPEYQEIDTAETAFLIPLEGDTTGQAKFASEKYLEERKVAAKRVQIVHRWNATGRTPGTGEWIPTVRLVKVRRSPVTREWTAEANRGTAQHDQAIWTESADSVGFSTGFTCTALVREEDAAKFLYYYPSGSLSEVMDSEVRGRVQKIASGVAGKYKLDELRGKKAEMIDAVQSDVTTFFAERGITVTTVGMFGGMSYENPSIQKAIDETFIAQQMRDLANSRLLVQQKENERIELEANAMAEKARREAQGQADAKLILAEAEAKSIRQISSAMADIGQNPAIIQLKLLDVEKARIERWNGALPAYYLGGAGEAMPMNMQLRMLIDPNASPTTAPAKSSPGLTLR